MPEDPYSLADLARLADVTPRTVRYYVAQGLLPSPDAAGPATRYGEGHLARIRLIRRLQRDHLPLAEIRARLERMGDEEVLAASAVLDPQEPEPSLVAQDTLDFVRTLMRDAGVRPTVATPQSPVRRLESMEAPAPRGARAPSLPPAPAPAPASPPPSVHSSPGPVPESSPARTAPDRTTWERLVISPDVELHVRRPLGRQTNKRVDQLERIARELFEDP